MVVVVVVDVVVEDFVVVVVLLVRLIRLHTKFEDTNPQWSLPV